MGDGIWQDAAIVGGVVFAAYLIVMWVAALVWAYRDIAARTRDQTTHAVSVLMVLIFSLPGLLLYLILRPKQTLAERYDRQLEAEALLHEIQEQASCPSCRRRIDHDFIACPYCRAALRTSCESCGRAMAFGWVLCAYCGADRPASVVRAVASGDPAPPAADAAPQRQRRASTATYTPPAKPAPDATADVGSQP